MRKFFQDYSITGVVLIFCVLILGFVFRFISLSDASAWGDEIASLFYAKNLAEIFQHESHTPFYYALCKIWMLIFGESILSLRYLFVFLSFTLLCLSSALLLKKKETGFFLLFFVTWWLWPSDIIYSRQARHYGLYAELSFFILLLWRQKNDYPSWAIILSCTLAQLLHPFMLIPVWFLVLYDFARKRLNVKKLLIILSSSLPLIIYYVARFLIFGREKVMSNIGWIQEKFLPYLEGLVKLFGGDSFPLNQVFPLSLVTTLVFLSCVVLVFMIKSRPRESLVKFILLMVLSIGAVQIASMFFSDLRIPRYVFFLLPFFLYALLDSCDESKPRINILRAQVMVIILCGYNLFIFKPWLIFDWDDQNVALFKETLKNLPERDLVVCGNRYQLDYYFNKPNLTCSQVAIGLLQKKTPFYLFDINGNDKVLLAYLLQESELSSVKTFNHALFVTVDPRR